MAEFKFEVEGYYTCRVLRPDGTERLSLTFPNIITNTGLNTMGQFGGFYGNSPYCSVGTGTTTPAAANTALVAFAAQTSSTFAGHGAGGVSGTSPYYGYGYLRYQFDAGVAVGTFTEIGIGLGENGTALNSRALVTDASGNPTSITVLAGEILQVTYELRQYAPTADVTSTQTINGTSYSLRVRAGMVLDQGAWGGALNGANQGNAYGSTIGAYSGAIGTTTAGSPGGDYVGSGSLSEGTYTNGQYYLDRVFSFAINEAIGTIGTLVIHAARGVFQIGITPAITKTDAQIFSGTIRYTWARRTI